MQILKTGLLVAGVLLFQQASPPTPLIRENVTVKASDHVYVIPDGNVGGVPNVVVLIDDSSSNLATGPRTLRL